MTLRARFTGIVLALLAVVLGGALFVLARWDARDVDRRLEDRARELALAPLPPAEAAAAAPGEGHAPAPSRLPPEGDGARVEVFLFDRWVAGAAGVPGPAVRRRASTDGAARLPEDLARAMVHPDAPRALRRVEAAGARWVVAVEPALPAAPPPVALGSGPPGPPGGPLGGGGPGPAAPPPPPPPPHAPPRPGIAVAFVDAGPATSGHRAYVARVALVGLGATVVGTLLASLLAGRMLRPVRAAAAAALAVARPQDRLPVPSSDDELSRLVGVLNGMLERLEASSERERRFLATASHELRRPLAALRAELELAGAPGREPERLREAIARGLEDAKSMGRLVDDLLGHARARAGTLRVDAQPVELTSLVEDAVARSRRTLAGALRVEVGPLPEVSLRGDADALRRVVENLVVNAATHGGGEARVLVAARADAETLHLTVEDDGPGIPAEELGRLFEPFGRGDRARSVAGFGLGLAIVRDLVEAHGGRVDARSPCREDPARPGTRFSVHLPLRATEVGDA